MQLLLWGETLRTLHWLRRSLEGDIIKQCKWEFRGHSWLEHKSAATRGGYKGYWITLHANTLFDSLCPRRSLLPSSLRKVWWRQVSLGVLTTRGRVQVWPCQKRLETRLACWHFCKWYSSNRHLWPSPQHAWSRLQVIFPYSTTPCYIACEYNRSPLVGFLPLAKRRFQSTCSHERRLYSRTTCLYDNPSLHSTTAREFSNRLVHLVTT